MPKRKIASERLFAGRIVSPVQGATSLLHPLHPSPLPTVLSFFDRRILFGDGVRLPTVTEWRIS